MISKKMFFVLICGVSLILVSISGVTPSEGLDVDAGSLYSHTVHPPIRINSNADFATQGWPGAGTEFDPYQISGLEIDGSDIGYSIFIGNTTVHFEIINNYLHNTTYHELKEFFMSSGIYLYNVQNGVIKNNIMSHNDFAGIVLEGGSQNTVIDNIAKYGGDYGIILYGSEYNIIKDNNLQLNDQGCSAGGGCGLGGFGICLAFSHNNQILNNNASWKNARGIALQSSNHNSVRENIIYHNTVYGLSLESSHQNEVKNNDIRNNRNGVFVAFSSTNHFEENDILFNTEVCFYLDRSTSAELVDNLLGSNGLVINGLNQQQWDSHIIDNSNTVNGKPLIYRNNLDGGTVPVGAGQIILANCKNMVVEGHEIIGTQRAIQMGFSHDNIIRSNVLSENEIALYLRSSENNVIYHNSFVDNTQDADDTGSNLWHNDWPDGGNYWGRHSGKDEFSGPAQDDEGSDGIIDVSYTIPGTDGTDLFPLKSPFASYVNIDITTPSNGDMFNTSAVDINWSYFTRFDELTGFELNANEDGWTDIGMVLEHSSDFPDGINVIALRASQDDYTGMTEVNFMVDTVPPSLNILSSLDGETLTKSTVLIEWNATDVTSGISSIHIRLNGGDWLDLGVVSQYQLSSLDSGEHTVEIKAWDMVGHTTTEELSFTVDLSSDDDDDDDTDVDDDDTDVDDDDPDDVVDDDDTDDVVDDDTDDVVDDDTDDVDDDDTDDVDDDTDDTDDEINIIDDTSVGFMGVNLPFFLLILAIIGIFGYLFVVYHSQGKTIEDDEEIEEDL